MEEISARPQTLLEKLGIKKGKKGISKAQKEDLQVAISELRLRGKTIQEIAKIAGFSVTRTYEVLSDIDERLFRHRDLSIEKIRFAQLRKMDRIESELWDSWDASKEGRIKEITRATKGKATVPGEVMALTQITEIEGSHGDPRYLAGVQAIIDRRCKILGLDLPSQKLASSADETMKYYSEMPGHERRAQIKELMDMLGWKNSEDIIIDAESIPYTETQAEMGGEADSSDSAGTDAGSAILP